MSTIIGQSDRTVALRLCVHPRKYVKQVAFNITPGGDEPIRVRGTHHDTGHQKVFAGDLVCVVDQRQNYFRIHIVIGEDSSRNAGLLEIWQSYWRDFEQETIRNFREYLESHPKMKEFLHDEQGSELPDGYGHIGGVNYYRAKHAITVSQTYGITAASLLETNGMAIDPDELVKRFELSPDVQMTGKLRRSVERFKNAVLKWSKGSWALVNDETLEDVSFDPKTESLVILAGVNSSTPLKFGLDVQEAWRKPEVKLIGDTYVVDYHPTLVIDLDDTLPADLANLAGSLSKHRMMSLSNLVDVHGIAIGKKTKAHVAIRYKGYYVFSSEQGVGPVVALNGETIGYIDCTDLHDIKVIDNPASNS